MCILTDRGRRIWLLAAVCAATLASALIGSPVEAGGGNKASPWANDPTQRMKAPPRAQPTTPQPQTQKAQPQSTPAQPTQAQKAEKSSQSLANDTSKSIEDCARTLAGRTLVECVTGKLEGLSKGLETNADTRALMPKSIEALKGAVAELKGATTKEQAISAIEKAKVVLAAALQTARKAAVVPGFGPQKGIVAISTTINVAIAAIQKKGDESPQIATPTPTVPPATAQAPAPVPVNAPANATAPAPTSSTKPAN